MKACKSKIKSVIKKGNQHFLLLFLYNFILALLCPLWEIRVAIPGRGTAAARAALAIPISVYSIFVCPNNGMAARVWGVYRTTFLTIPCLLIASPELLALRSLSGEFASQFTLTTV